MCNEDSSPTVTNCTFSNNTADGVGGMYNFSSSPTVTNCTFSGNTGGRSGGMSNNMSFPTVADCTFSGNQGSDGLGGGMTNFSSSPVVTNSIFSINSAAGASGRGGGMLNSNSSPSVTNCTFSGNVASGGGGGMYNWNSSSPTVTNCVLWGDNAPTGPEVGNDTSSPTISYSEVQGCGGSGGGWDPSIGADAGDNIDSDPLFVNAPLRTDLTVADGIATTVEITDAATNYAIGDVIELDDDGVVRTVSDVTGTTVTFASALAAASAEGTLVQNWGPGATDLDLDLHLSATSPCIDTGTDVGAPPDDIEGTPRPQGSFYDMGAYEYQ